MSEQIKVYNEEGTLVAVDMETILELLELNVPVHYENIILDFMSEYDKQYEYTTDEEYYSRHNPQPFEFEVNVI